MILVLLGLLISATYGVVQDASNQVLASEKGSCLVYKSQGIAFDMKLTDQNQQYSAIGIRTGVRQAKIRDIMKEYRADKPVLPVFVHNLSDLFEKELSKLEFVDWFLSIDAKSSIKFILYGPFLEMFNDDLEKWIIDFWNKNLKLVDEVLKEGKLEDISDLTETEEVNVAQLMSKAYEPNFLQLFKESGIPLEELLQCFLLQTHESQIGFLTYNAEFEELFNSFEGFREYWEHILKENDNNAQIAKYFSDDKGLNVILDKAIQRQGVFKSYKYLKLPKEPEYLIDWLSNQKIEEKLSNLASEEGLIEYISCFHNGIALLNDVLGSERAIRKFVAASKTTKQEKQKKAKQIEKYITEILLDESSKDFYEKLLNYKKNISPNDVLTYFEECDSNTKMTLLMKVLGFQQVLLLSDAGEELCVQFLLGNINMPKEYF